MSESVLTSPRKTPSTHRVRGVRPDRIRAPVQEVRLHLRTGDESVDPGHVELRLRPKRAVAGQIVVSRFPNSGIVTFWAHREPRTYPSGMLGKMKPTTQLFLCHFALFSAEAIHGP